MFPIRIRQHELALHFRHGDFVEVLRPGVYRGLARVLLRLFGRDRYEIIDTLQTRFEHDLLDLLVKEAVLAGELLVVDVLDDERALLWKDGRLEEILGPGKHAFWKHPYALEVEVHTIGAGRFEHERLETLLAHVDASRYFQEVRAAKNEHVLLFRDGALVDSLTSGVAVFWRQTSEVRWTAVNLREQLADVSGQEIMTADKVSLRVNLLVTFRVTDAIRAVETVESYVQTLYREAQLALRAAVGVRTLDRMLADKEAVGEEVRAVIAARAADFGVAVQGVGLRDLILPGDMKTILNQVIEAEKRAEADLIRRREETAAARSQVNTARLLAANPVLARMKELEAVQEILAGSKATFLFGQGDLVRQVKSLTDPPGSNGES